MRTKKSKGTGIANVDTAYEHEVNSSYDAMPVTSLSEGGLWRQAAAEVDWKPPAGLSLKTIDTLGLLDSLCQDIRGEMSEGDDNERKWGLQRGKKTDFRQIWGKILGWVKKFQTIGDIAVQADAGYASLPWVL